MPGTTLLGTHVGARVHRSPVRRPPDDGACVVPARGGPQWADGPALGGARQADHAAMHHVDVASLPGDARQHPGLGQWSIGDLLPRDRGEVLPTPGGEWTPPRGLVAPAHDGHDDGPRAEMPGQYRVGAADVGDAVVHAGVLWTYYCPLWSGRCVNPFLRSWRRAFRQSAQR
jgi:hypothetical protein